MDDVFTKENLIIIFNFAIFILGLWTKWQQGRNTASIAVAKDEAIQTTKKIDAIAETVDSTAKVTDKTHEAVNSERTHMQEELKKLNDDKTEMKVQMQKLSDLVSKLMNERKGAKE